MCDLGIRFYLSSNIKNSLKSHYLDVKTLRFCHHVCNVVLDVIT